MLFRPLAFLIAALLPVLLTGRADAATLTLVKKKLQMHGPNLAGHDLYDYDWHISLSGEIKRGDARALKKLLDKNDLTMDVNKAVVHFDSPGGSYFEGLKIGQLINSYGLSTFIGRGKRCESACAMAFMAGKDWNGFNLTFPHRILHPQGRLGFHAAFLKLDPNKKYSAGEVQRLQESKRAALHESLVFAKKVGIDADLVRDIFARGASDMFAIDTVARALRSNIILAVDFSRPLIAKMSQEHALNACSILFRLFDTTMEELTEFAGANREPMGEDLTRTIWSVNFQEWRSIANNGFKYCGITNKTDSEGNYQALSQDIATLEWSEDGTPISPASIFWLSHDQSTSGLPGAAIVDIFPQ